MPEASCWGPRAGLDHFRFWVIWTMQVTEVKVRRLTLEFVATELFVFDVFFHS